MNRLPSSVEMMKLAAADPEVQKLMDAERYAQIAADFAADIPVNAEKSSAPEAPAAPIGTIDTSWMQGLKRNPNTGQYEKTIDNMIIVLTHDPLIARIGYDDFASRIMVLGAMPWNRCSAIRPWDDTDDAGSRWYLEKAYGMTGRDKAQDAVTRAAALNTFDPVRDYLNGLKWDGVPRLDTLFIDYLGAADNEYTRAAARKSLCAAVARVFKPGTKYDFMPVLTGPQGIGKSTLLRRIGRDVWFTDAVNSFDGKEADEIIRGMWIVEIGELEAMNRSEVGRVKQVLSQNVSRFRAAYGRHVQDIPRRCVFFGTSNNREYLRDSTGGRRFWPIDCGIIKPTKDVFKDLAGEVDQLWAEAVEAYKKGEKLYMTGGLAEHAKKEQEEHREHSPLEGSISEWLEKPIPKDWSNWDLPRRRMYWGGGLQYDGETVSRQRVCAVEIWCEYLNGEQKYMQRKNTMEINAAMQALPDWEYISTPRAFGPYGNQRGYGRTV